MASNPTPSATTKGLRARTGPSCTSKIARPSIAIPCGATLVIRPSPSDHGRYLASGRNMQAETKDTSAPVSMITIHREPSSEATARVWAGRKSGGGCRGVGSIFPPLDLDRCWVSSASYTLAASRVDPSTTTSPGGLSLASWREVAHPGYHIPQQPSSRTKSRLQPRLSSMRSPGGLEPLARGKTVEVQVPNRHLHPRAPREPGGVGLSPRSARTHPPLPQRRWEFKSTAEYNESAPAPSEHHQKSGPAGPAKLGSQHLAKPQNERLTPPDIQELLDSALQVRRHGPVRLGARAGTNAALEGYIR